VRGQVGGGKGGLLAALLAGYAFLYAPIVFLIAFSFNDAKLVTAWAGFSWRWYQVLWHDEPLLKSALLSLRIAASSATLALIVGTLAGTALARFGAFRARLAFEAAVAAPLVLPEVITGLSLLLLFVAMDQAVGWPAGRGELTVTLAHASVSVAYAAVVVRARLAGLTPVLEEAPRPIFTRRR
jgi:putrescine transport system permease protein